jgi:ADP-dependent NAD(P)H-hydrate dehydratase / NAD(P)H-hydrate epimerase
MSRGLEILTVAEMTASDRAAITAGTPGSVLMERAGGRVADAICARWTPRRVVILCGPGNNGGDGYVVARRLAEAGWEARTSSLARDGLKGDAAEAFGRWSGPDAPLSAEACSGAELVVDALFGAGLSKPLDAAVQAPLRAAEAAGLPVVGVDLPSGLPGDRAGPLDYAPACALTVTFHRKKLAHVLEPGRALCGEVVVGDIGLGDPPASVTLYENAPGLWSELFPWPGVEAHKHSRGALVVVSGGLTHTGAARLAARAGLRIGAGLVTVLSPPGAVLAIATHLEAVMLTAFGNPGELAEAAGKASAAVIGPAAGVGESTRANVLALASSQARLVVDADALTSFREDPEALFAELGAGDVMTPHPGEFERVFPGLLKGSPERITAARAAAARAGAVVLLKGPDTVIAAPDGRAAVNTNGAPWLATAGSGDALAGFIGGLIAQGMPSFEAACAGAWIHAEAGAMFGPGLIAEDLPGLAPQVLRRLRG